MRQNDDTRCFIKNSDWNDTFVELLPGGIGIYEANKEEITSVYASEGILRLLSGYRDKEIKELAKHIEKLIYRKDMSLLISEINQAIKEKRNLDIKVRYHKSPDKLGWLWIRGKILKASENRTVFFALLLEVSHMKNLETNLLIQQQRYRILEETSSEILFELKPKEDEMTYSLKELDGTLSRKVVKNYMQSLETRPMVHPDSMDEFKSHLMRAMKEPASGQFEYLSSISGRGYEWHCLTYTSITDVSGHIESIFGRIKNIHDEVLKRKAHEETEAIDNSTNLYHRHYLISKIKEKMAEGGINSGHTLILIGIKHFSELVKQNGHSGGDAAISFISQLFGKVLPEAAVFGRKGNDKLLVYIANGDDDEINEKIKEFLAMLVLPENRVADINISCSVGIASVIGCISYEELFDKAEEALFRAKISSDTDFIRVS